MNTVTRLLATVVIATSTMMTAANAAVIEISDDHCNNDDPKCTIINLHGEIRPGDDKTFAAVIKNIKNDVFVLLNSNGGEFEAGMGIARQVKNRQFKTGASFCVSICAVIWLSGSSRRYLRESSIGMHGVYTMWSDRNGNIIKGKGAVSSSSGNAVLGAYFAELGLAPKTIATLTEAAPNEMYWLKTKNLKDLGIEATRAN